MTSIYPALGQSGYAQALMRGKNYQALAIPEMEPVLTEKQFEKKANDYCEGYEKFLYQYIAQQHLSPFSPYRGLLLYHGLGFGKTCSAITFAEAMLNHQSGIEMPPKSVWVITSSALEDNFKSQLHRPGAAGSCMGNAYDSLGGVAAIDARYTFFTYDKFGSLVKEKQENHTLKAWATNRVLLIDEAHNLRNASIRGAAGLEAFLKAGTNNRLVLLSATPMFDQPDELIQLLYYLVLNDHRTDLPLTPKAIKETSFYTPTGDALNPVWLPVFQQLCANYISFVKGTNPFNLAVRLKPTASGIPVLTAATVPKVGYFGDTANNGGWLKWIDDGLLGTVMSPLQSERLFHLSFVKETVKAKMARVADGKEPTLIHTNVLEGTNVIYPGGTAKKPKFLVGSDGFQSILKPTVYGNSSKVLYYDYYDKPYLYPSAKYLKTYAVKLYRAAEILQQSKGIVLIYSHFIWSGIMPMAMVLEHLGYGRYKDSNLLKPRDYADADATAAAEGSLPKTPGRSYAIFCSDPVISGVDTFQALLDEINAPTNQHGETVKVILMSPVASEGISFKHVREVHILDPWFHMNRLEQVIGRSIRTCSHQALPLAERNVSVFLHVSQYAPEVVQNKETYDLYTYRIASHKKEKMTEIETLIRNHALDCALQTHVNYYPTKLFPFKLRMHTSQEVETFVALGDSVEKEPKCVAASSANGAKKTVGRSWRRESYAPLKEVAKERLRKILLSGKSANRSWDTDSLLAHLRLPVEVGWLGLEALRDEGIVIKGVPYRLVFHRMKVWLRPEATMALEVPRNIAVVPEKERGREGDGEGDGKGKPKGNGKDKETDTGTGAECDELVEMMMQYDVSGMANDTMVMVSFLTLLNVDCWEPFAKRLIREGIQSRLTEVLWKNGWLITAKEIGAGGAASGSQTPERFVGYSLIDLMKKETDMVVRIHTGTGTGTDAWRDATKAEMQRVIAGRQRLDDMKAPFGFYSLYQKEGQPPVFKLKLMLDTSAKRDRTGIVSTTVSSNALRELIERLRAMFPREPAIAPNFEVKDNRTNRTYLSSWVAYYMGMLGRLRIPPIYKIGNIV